MGSWCYNRMFLVVIPFIGQFFCPSEAWAWSNWTRHSFGICLSNCKQRVNYTRICTNIPHSGTGSECSGSNFNSMWKTCSGGECPNTSKIIKEKETLSIQTIIILSSAGGGIVVFVAAVYSIKRYRDKKQSESLPYVKINPRYCLRNTYERPHNSNRMLFADSNPFIPYIIYSTDHNTYNTQHPYSNTGHYYHTSSGSDRSYQMNSGSSQGHHTHSGGGRSHHMNRSDHGHHTHSGSYRSHHSHSGSERGHHSHGGIDHNQHSHSTDNAPFRSNTQYKQAQYRLSSSY